MNVSIHSILSPVEELSQSRNLGDGSYQPDWRLRVVEQYLLQLAKAEDKPHEFDAILRAENDASVRELLVFHHKGTAPLQDPIRYALGRRVTNPQDRMGSLIKMLIVCERTAEEIATQLGTEAENIEMFEDLLFDVRRYRNNTAFLMRICFPAAQEPTPETECERHWLGIAFRYGFAGVESFLSKKQSALTDPLAQLEQAKKILTRRSLDFVSDLDIAGLLPSPRDIRLLGALQRLLSTPAPPAPITEEPAVENSGQSVFPDYTAVLESLKEISETSQLKKTVLTWLLDLNQRNVAAQASQLSEQNPDLTSAPQSETSPAPESVLNN